MSRILCIRSSRFTRCASIVIATLVLTIAAQARATIMQGDLFILDWLATSGPSAGASGSADVKIGAPQTSPFFGIAAFDVTAAGFCGVCTPLTEDLSGAQFDSTTFGVLGTITGSFAGQAGASHTFSLVLNDVAGGVGTFTFSDTRVGDGTITNGGTYTPLVASVDEPSELLVLAIGLVGLGLTRRRKLN